MEVEGPDVPDDAVVVRTCTVGERRALSRGAADRGEAFGRCWVRKEAVAKALGAGLRLPFDPLDVRTDAVAVPGAAGAWRVRDLDAEFGYVGAVAAAAAPTRPGGGWSAQSSGPHALTPSE